ncbi:unnamed protein product [Penicillium nalgiovense]|uniref:Uncharacterized protein n=1 Tax=Penicillium nalgiovense TaxID=60175 RepID=A0A9W4MYI2_PENNA|nr:unnamed protein product [Penicillium nalgiovense]CAG8066458.1 unnamed protein product [Penicillium nalgiovense]CAG8084072.1 unnamed protein product [Penicillium nalgiovense]CAG8147573.1 unnamed protein product [Penicillium nalgiovense]CAG8154579.1 unnamed protein product [Penicillium nalgiovense]
MLYSKAASILPSLFILLNQDLLTIYLFRLLPPSVYYIYLLCFGGVLADQHNFCACGTRHGRNAVQDAYWDFDTAASTFACTRYRNRNTGTKQWDNCPDCEEPAPQQLTMHSF